jgi:uncharacterized Tic20 family protein
MKGPDMSNEETPPSASPADETAAVGPITSEEKTWGMLCHLSAFLGYFAAGMTFVGPLICWLIKKDTSKFVDYNGKESLNFHINVLAYDVICIIGIFATCGIGIFIFGPLLAVIHIYVIVIMIVAGLKANAGEYFKYPAIIRIIK